MRRAALLEPVGCFDPVSPGFDQPDCLSRQEMCEKHYLFAHGNRATSAVDSARFTPALANTLFAHLGNRNSLRDTSMWGQHPHVMVNAALLGLAGQALGGLEFLAAGYFE